MIEFSRKTRSETPVVNLTPMVDIIFNLLLFFLVTAAVSQQGLELELPDAKSADGRAQSTLEISVTESARIVFDGETVSEERVESLLRSHKKAGRNEPIVLRADEGAPFGKFVFVMDTARSLGLTNLVIATDMKKGRP